MSALRPVAAIVAVAFTLLLSPVAAQAGKSPSPMVNKINKVRTGYGLRPMHYSRSLSGSSSRFARHLARTRQFAHGSHISASARFSRLGEVLALMRGWQVQRALTLAYWLQSPAHRAVMLSPGFRYVGAARARAHFGGNRVLVWTVQFGR